MVFKNNINNLFHKINRKFRNFIFKNRFGKNYWSVKLIIFIMNMLDCFEIYTNTNDVGRFDHYVPKFLLKNWRISETGTDKGYIFSWSKNNNRIEKVSLSKEAGVIDWDVFNSQGVPSDFLSKKVFAELLEDKASRVVKLINNNSSIELTFLEKSTLAVFIAHQVTRVPAFHESLAHFLSIGYSNNLLNKEDLGNKKHLVQKVVFNKIGITYDQFLNEEPKTIIENIKSQKIFLSIEVATNIAEKIYRGNLHILEIPTNSSDEFVISDNPVVFLDMDREKLLEIIPWWEIGQANFFILMPISRKKAIFYSKLKKKDGPVENKNKELIQLLNAGQYLFCTNKIFCQNQEILNNHLKMYDSELQANNTIK